MEPASSQVDFETFALDDVDEAWRQQASGAKAVVRDLTSHKARPAAPTHDHRSSAPQRLPNGHTSGARGAMACNAAERAQSFFRRFHFR